MDEQSIRDLAKKYNAHYGILEIDYALTNLLSIIADFPKLNKMVFKGGTALKKIHFKDFRFSQDLDFVCLEDISDDFMNFIKNNIKDLDVKFTELADIVKMNQGFKFRAKFIQSNGSSTSIRMDLSLRGDLMMKPHLKPVLHFYETLQKPFSLCVMDLEEIMAEKIRAVIYSKHPRHLFDIQFLHHHGVKIDPDMVKAKIKIVHDEDFDLDKLRDRLPEKEKKWTSDLKPFLPNEPPPFVDVSNEVLQVITDAMN